MTNDATKLQALRAVLAAAIDLIDSGNASAAVAVATAPVAVKTPARIVRGNQNYFEAEVDSSNLARVKYWKNTQTLRVTFHNGAEYDYAAVPADVVQDLITADSVGGYFNRNIKNTYRYARV